MKIRRLTQADEPFLWEMLYHALFVPEGDSPFPRDIVNRPEVARCVLGWGRTGDDGFAAVDETTQQPVGAVWIRLFTSDNRGYGYVGDDTPELSIALLPGYRNQGVGTALLNQMIATARSKYAALSLSVSSKNPAKRLYERLGFEIIKQDGAALTMLKRFGEPDV